MPSTQRRTLQAAVAAAIATAAAATHPAHAQSTTSADPRLEQIVVVGQIIYRDRVETTPPVLEYGLDYFQRFEPLTVGDMLKRVPSVAFLSDVLEFDAVRLRGLDAGYTQILINGRKTPGSEADRSFFVDRIPAELIDRIEIVRSPSAGWQGVPFLAAPDRPGVRQPFVVHWAAANDVSGGIVARGIGPGAELLKGTIDSTDIYRALRLALFP